MVIGQLLHATTTQPYYTPWSGRRGNSAVMVLDVIACSLTGGTGAQISVQTKNSEDPDSSPTPDTLGSFANITSVPATPPTLYVSGFKELYRLKVTFVSTGADDWLHFRQLQPSWVTN
jgi:hypothetical protein